MESHLIWLAAAFILVLAELVTGTFFLLVLGIAAFAGSAAAWFGLGFWLQVLISSGLAVAGVLWVRQHRKSTPQSDMASLDVGQAVTLDAWVSREQGTARVKYRNTLWDAEVEGEREFDHGQMLFIRAVNGNTLKVVKTKP
jgi:membrane protein implicated in regulation of membrane protease activity